MTMRFLTARERRPFMIAVLWVVGLLMSPSLGKAQFSTSQIQPADPLVWYDAVMLPTEGQGWTDLASRYDRFPARAQMMVRLPVWELSQNSAGLSVRFVTDATKIRVRWTLRSERLAMPHMAATGVSGVDLYVKHDNKWRFLAVGRPTQFPVNDVLLTQGLQAGQKEFRLSFPLYNGVEKVEIGIPPSATFRTPDPLPKQKPIVFYGTSITQGGCASRPGMSYPAILGRRMEMPVINLGFSGNGKSEPEMATLLAELDPALYVIDCLPNLETAQAVERLPGFIATLRAAHPETPILLVENFIYTNSPFVAERDAKQRTSTEFLQEFHERLKAAGDQHLFIVSAENLIGTDGEATVDALHPTDAGFLRMADVLEPAIRQAIAHH